MNALAQAIIDAGLAKQDDKRAKQKEGWNARLSFRTYNSLKEQGVPASDKEATAKAA